MYWGVGVPQNVITAVAILGGVTANFTGTRKLLQAPAWHPALLAVLLVFIPCPAQGCILVSVCCRPLELCCFGWNLAQPRCDTSPFKSLQLPGRTCNSFCVPLGGGEQQA